MMQLASMKDKSANNMSRSLVRGACRLYYQVFVSFLEHILNILEDSGRK